MLNSTRRKEEEENNDYLHCLHCTVKEWRSGSVWIEVYNIKLSSRILMLAHDDAASTK